METKLHQPHISTLVVEVQVIKIGNNKMTLSVFDQLYEDAPWSDIYKVIYPIWGKVNRSGNDYVIFLKNSELRKYPIPMTKSIQSFEDSILKSTEYVDALHGWHLRFAAKIYKEKQKWWAGLSIQETEKFFTPGAPRYFPFKPTLSGIEKFIDNVTETEKDQIMDEYNNKVKMCNMFNEMVDHLKASNQLFVAV